MAIRESEENFGRDSCVAAASKQLDCTVEVGLAVGEPLREVDRVAGLDQLVQAPAGDLVAVGLVVFDNLGHIYAFDRACFVLS